MVTVQRRWPLVALLVGALLLIVSGLAITRGQQPVVHKATSLPRARTIIAVSPAASAEPSASPTSAPVEGMRIQIPKLGIDLPVVAGDGVNAPLYKAVLDPFLAQPGSGSRSMIYAHAQNGMFGPLFNTRVGYHVIVRRAGQADLKYTITNYYAHWPVNDLSPLQPMAREQLVLVTCTTYNLNDPRQVVFASPA